MATRVLIMAGGTGGHVYPALAVARDLIDRGCEVRWMGTRGGLEARVVPAAAIPIDWLSVSGFRGKGFAGRVAAPLRLMLACWQAGRILRRFRPDVVLGMGGFVAGPGGIMAKLFGVPLVVHEQNRIPGTTNRILVRWAREVLEAFPGSFPSPVGALCVGNPLRADFVASASDKAPHAGPVHILVVGGSQGAQALNRIVPDALARLERPVRVTHQTGPAMRDETEARYRYLGLEARVEAFLDDMADAYARADLAICRAGAMTVSELTAMGVPALLVPYPHAIDDHQTHNARYLSDAGAAVLLPQTELTPDHLAVTLRSLIETPERLAEMARRARALAKLDATRAVADICLREAGA
jgi:UDP-N-acetylglucosamine--N-acetylmuramyl-(pentapeptide) pyrophosphoryl-undecaprenol N-acetylglucosamine transferase